MFKKSIFILIFLLSFVTFMGKAEAASPFTDVSEKFGAYEDIIALSEAGIIQGFPDGTYGPYHKLTRAQGAIIIGRALDIDINQASQHSFKDVNNKVSGHEYINALTNKGIFNKAKKFHPYDSLTRAQMAKILVQSFDLQGNSKKSFKDVPKDHWAYKNIQTLVATGITNGTSSNTFSPNDVVNRVQMASFVNRAIHYDNDSDQTGQQQSFEVFANEIFKLTNKERVKHDLAPFKRHQGVEKLAMLKAKDLYVNDYFDHTSPVHGTPFDMMKEADIKYYAAGENIARGYPSAEAVVDGWMNSPGHRKNILSKKFTHIGVGFYEPDNNQNKQYVQMFIKPR